MERAGSVIFFIGAAMAVVAGLLVSLNLGWVCQLSVENPPQSFLSYPALCFIAWAYSVPVGMILAAAGALIWGGAGRHLSWTFLGGTLAVFLFITFANGPMPHVPPLFGIGGALILLFYVLILWANRRHFSQNALSLAGYTFLVIGLWWTCGLGSQAYHPELDSNESPIDILVYFVLAMLFFWLGEARRRAAGAR